MVFLRLLTRARSQNDGQTETQENNADNDTRARLPQALVGPVCVSSLSMCHVSETRSGTRRLTVCVSRLCPRASIALWSVARALHSFCSSH